MPHHDTTALSGTISHVFAHRFVIQADGTSHLADLGPKGLEAFPLVSGQSVNLEGERRPSEIKVTRIWADGGEPVAIHHKKPQHAPGPARPELPADLCKALAAVEAAGWTSIGTPHRKPHHFEILARRGEGPLTELHVDGAGVVYKTRSPAGR